MSEKIKVSLPKKLFQKEHTSEQMKKVNESYGGWVKELKQMSYSTYYLEKGDEIPCMRCGEKIILKCEPPKCCKDEQDAALNMCGCQGAPVPIFCDKCWEELENK